MASSVIPSIWKICWFMAYSSVVKSGASSRRGSGGGVGIDEMVQLKRVRC